jgi:hypothetical protein
MSERYPKVAGWSMGLAALAHDFAFASAFRRPQWT